MTWSSYIVLTEPIPERLADIGWTGGEGLADARFTLHYLRTTRDGRIAIGGGGGRAGFGGRIDEVFTDDYRSARAPRPGLRRLFPSLREVRIEDAWGGPIDISADHLPWSVGVRGRPDPRRPWATAATASGRRSCSAGSWRPRPWSAADDPALACPRSAARSRGRSRPSRPGTSARGSSARRPSRREAREERGEPVGPLTRELSAGCSRRLGYHLGPD